ncbi:hypothetical protein [Pseudoroseomonas sp. WGS1072]|uniref:hypothetical protein n=1 Tax=Roseomonas sp. WGS1072 TaxID=3366816 RepID=UPI003BF445AE
MRPVCLVILLLLSLAAALAGLTFGRSGNAASETSLCGQASASLSPGQRADCMARVFRQ